METDKKNIDYINKTLTSLLDDRYSTAESTRTNYARGEDIFDPNNIMNPGKVIDV